MNQVSTDWTIRAAAGSTEGNKVNIVSGLLHGYFFAGHNFKSPPLSAATKYWPGATFPEKNRGWKTADTRGAAFLCTRYKPGLIGYAADQEHARISGYLLG